MSATVPVPSSREVRMRQAARELWLQQGYATSMRAVAERAGCSKQTIYAHFGTKDELFRQVIDELIAPMTAPVADAGDDLRGNLIAFAHSHAGFAADADTIVQRRRLIAEFERFPEPSSGAFAAWLDGVSGRLAELLAGAMRRGLLRTDAASADELAELLLSMIHGMEANRLLFDLGRRGDAAARERWIKRAVDAFLRAWASQPEPAPTLLPPGPIR